MNQVFSKKHPRGFNFVEMMTALGIAGILGVTGLNSYRKQRHQARAAQAQYNLSNIYTAEKNFYTQWNAYHENLYIIGAIPEGELWYDAGFTDTPVGSDGNLPHYPWQNKLTSHHCNTFHQLCTFECADLISPPYSPVLYGKPGTYAGNSYQGITCSVIGGSSRVASYTGYGASATSFKALATAELNSLDQWTINEKQEVKHIVDGTGN
ncbi:MAG: prepilin-type N-terminal cleavage/methylation domain-containing protein [Bdellovibrionales bacterium]|nr:prepilin-type N-terminal cleavage/methylation domain-containing protein [Bdellovibrionales bacterium]